MKKTIFAFLIAITTISIMTTTLLSKTENKIQFTIVHTNDMHSHLLGFSPNIDYTSNKQNDDKTIGGWARVATVIKQTKENRKNDVFVLDAGDFLMGSLFHMLAREEAFELQLLKKMGYDAVALGNHEFDLTPDGLAQIIRSAQKKNLLPTLLASNLIFDKKSTKDDSLEKVFNEGLILPYKIYIRKGIKIAIFGLMGKGAAEVAPFKKPVKIENYITSAKKTVAMLRKEKKADFVICLSHSGLFKDKSKSEDEILAKKVKGINIIISGHTHTKIKKPIIVGDTIIVQSWEYAKQVGVLDVFFNTQTKKLTLNKHKFVDIDDSIKADLAITAEINLFKTMINDRVLQKWNLSFNKVIAETSYDLLIQEKESNLGNLIADAIVEYANKYEYDSKDPNSKIVFGVIGNGPIRDNILRGKTGKVATSDIFRAIPLGIGFDKEKSLGYPLITFYITAAEIKKGLEILTTIYKLKGGDYFLQISGVKVKYNPNRVWFDRVTDIQIGNAKEGYKKLDYSSSNKKLYRLTADIYNATFLKIVGKFTFGILDIVPKDKNGKPIKDLLKVRIDRDKSQKGIQEAKEWVAVFDYIEHFKDTDNNGIPNFPEKYRGTEDRIVAQASINPYHLLKNGTYVTWLTFLVLVILTGLIGFIIRFILKKFILN